jgi:hypothetical protein
VLHSSSQFDFAHAIEPYKFPNTGSADARLSMGKLSKMNFPKFDGKHPKLWQSHCETYFDMYMVDPSVWVRVVPMHFDGPTIHWLQSLNHRIHTATWTELCNWIHDRFSRDQHESLIQQLFHIK